VATLAIRGQPAADTGEYGGATPGEDNYVARVIVDVMLKPEIHDPQGEAVLSAAHRLAFGNVTGVRQGKRFEVEIDGPADGAALAAVEELARELLANPVIEEFSLHTTE
jgi:phosphoribosylformylglycinamidine synthase PurS subunit